MKNKLFEEQQEFKQYYDLQNNLRDKVIKQDQLPEIIKYIAGVDVAYNDGSDKMIGAIVVLNAQTREVIEQAFHEMEITFPYIPGYFLLEKSLL